MQRVAALYDIHGNLPALEAVLAEVKLLAVDAIVVGGDVLPGPMPAECLTLLASTGIRTEYIVGNGESAAREALLGQVPERVPEPFRPLVQWSAAQLPDEFAAAIRGWPLTTELEIDGIGRVLFCHATPRNDTEIVTKLSPMDRLRTVLVDVHSDLVVCGHTHMQFDIMVDAVQLVNAGSVGMPFGAPGAYWLLLGPDVQLRDTRYDLEAAADRLRRSEFPGVSDYVSRQVLNPPSEDHMLAAYARVDGRS
ncbi:MAG TPA: metallophosphoesterase family protein [Gemmatimonadaceae bacterium]